MPTSDDPVKLGVTIFALIGVSVGVILIFFWSSITAGEKATVAIGGVGALGTATLALATFWTVRQNKITLKNLQKERRKPLILDMLSEVIDPIIESSQENKNMLRGGRIWQNGRGDGLNSDVRVVRPPARRDIDAATWKEFEEKYSGLHSNCEKWWNTINEIDQDANSLARALWEDDGYSNVTDKPHAVRAVMNATRFADGTDGPVDDIDEYRGYMFQNHQDEHHSYWRSQWDLFKLNRSIHTNAVEMKRDLQSEYGISNREISEHQSQVQN